MPSRTSLFTNTQPVGDTWYPFSNASFTSLTPASYSSSNPLPFPMPHYTSHVTPTHTPLFLFTLPRHVEKHMLYAIITLGYNDWKSITITGDVYRPECGSITNGTDTAGG